MILLGEKATQNASFGVGIAPLCRLQIRGRSKTSSKGQMKVFNKEKGLQNSRNMYSFASKRIRHRKIKYESKRLMKGLLSLSRVKGSRNKLSIIMVKQAKQEFPFVFQFMLLRNLTA